MTEVEDKILSAYGDGWFDGFLAAKDIEETDENLCDYNQNNIIYMSELAEEKCLFGVRGSKKSEQIALIKTLISTIERENISQEAKTLLLSVKATLPKKS